MAELDVEQQLDSEVADLQERLKEIKQYFEEHCSSDHKLKELWLGIALSALQGFEHVNHPPHKWNDNPTENQTSREKEKSER